MFAPGKKEAGWQIPDILVNSAGVTHSSLLMAMKEDSVHHIIDVNLKGTIFACQAVSKAVIRSKRGKYDTKMKNKLCIINISSLLATHGGRGSSVYSASKAGILGKFFQYSHGSGRIFSTISVRMPSLAARRASNSAPLTTQ